MNEKTSASRGSQWLNPQCAEMMNHGPLFAGSEWPNDKLTRSPGGADNNKPEGGDRNEKSIL